MTYAWDFGDGAKAQGSDVKHTYKANGQYIARLTVTDAKKGHRTAETLVTVGDTARWWPSPRRRTATWFCQGRW